MLYTCPWCGFQTTIKFNIHRHFSRKCSCQLLLEIVPISECVQTIICAEKIASAETSASYKKTSAASAETSAAKCSITLFVTNNVAIVNQSLGMN